MTAKNSQPTFTTISQVSNFVDKRVLLKGWLYNKRGSGKLLFLHVRDGSGFIQGILPKEGFDEALFERIKKLGQESSIIVSGTVKKEDRAPYCGYELHLDQVEIVNECEDYPISKKAHGDAFLMHHRHLWLRSRSQHAILRIRASIIKAIRDYFDTRGFLLMDSPIFTANACEGTTTLFKTKW